MGKQDVIDLFVQAVDLAKERTGLSKQEKALLNKFKILLLNDSVDAADREFAQLGKIHKKTLHRIRELAEAIFEDLVRNLDANPEEREKELRDGKIRADLAEDYLLNLLKHQGLLLEN